MSPPVQPLLGARALADWIRAGGKPARAPFGYSLRLAWQAHWFELNWRTQVERLAQSSLPDDPVFILGLWRSGTTVLHELITACGGWTTPRTWQCFNPSTCFLTGPPTRQSTAARPMDRGRIETSSPQEDEFALLLLGEPSIYRGLIDPRRLTECGARLWSQDEGPLGRWHDFLRGLARGGEDRLLLKSPTHTFRLPLIRRLFPRARFIWIGRRLGEVLASNSRMWSAMMGTYALWDCPPGAIEQLMRDALRACANVLEHCLSETTADRMLWVDYEMLQSEPARVLKQALRFIGASAARDEASLAAAVDSALASVPIHPGQRAEQPDEKAVVALDELMREARRRFGGERSDLA